MGSPAWNFQPCIFQLAVLEPSVNVAVHNPHEAAIVSGLNCTSYVFRIEKAGIESSHLRIRIKEAR